MRFGWWISSCIRDTRCNRRRERFSIPDAFAAPAAAMWLHIAVLWALDCYVVAPANGARPFPKMAAAVSTRCRWARFGAPHADQVLSHDFAVNPAPPRHSASSNVDAIQHLCTAEWLAALTVFRLAEWKWFSLPPNRLRTHFRSIRWPFWCCPIFAHVWWAPSRGGQVCPRWSRAPRINRFRGNDSERFRLCSGWTFLGNPKVYRQYSRAPPLFVYQMEECERLVWEEESARAENKEILTSRRSPLDYFECLVTIRWWCRV